MPYKIEAQLKKLSTGPGVYLFYATAKEGKSRGELLYIGKAASLKSRVGSYFQKKLNFERPIEFVIEQVCEIETKETDSVLEAYFLEQELIGQLQPKFNVMGKDDKSFVYVCVTQGDFPRFEIRRKTDFDSGLLGDFAKIYGPFTAKHLVERALKILRKIFPYHNRAQETEKGCLDYQIGLCPGPYAGKISKEEYEQNIKAIELMFSGKKKLLLKRMKTEMQDRARKQEFEEAAKLRNQIFALEHIQDMALISERSRQKLRDNEKLRVEGYDISNTGEVGIVGSMVVFDNQFGELVPNKSEYRKFKIRHKEGQNDLFAMKEVLTRRFSNDWQRPDLIILDGGMTHLRMARDLFGELKISVPLLAVAKGPTRKKLDIFSYGQVPKITKRSIAQVRDESHRFAVTFHRKVRGQAFLK